jgi:hypothetical protein
MLFKGDVTGLGAGKASVDSFLDFFFEKTPLVEATGSAGSASAFSFLAAFGGRLIFSFLGKRASGEEFPPESKFRIFVPGLALSSSIT